MNGIPGALAIAGPTASGKTAAAMAIAARRPVEIISVDSALVYRGMDIGTAKPTAAELAAVPHHLVNIRDPLQAYSAAEFVVDAQALIEAINARGRLALLVGGTMLYFKALFEGLDAMPKADPAVRAQLEAEAANKGWPAMHALLAEADPLTAARLQPGDSQRIQRALEVFRVSGQPMSAFHTGRKSGGAASLPLSPWERAGVRVGAPTALPSPQPSPSGGGSKPVALIALEPRERSWLHERIAQRFDAMLAAGLLDEVRALRARGDLSPELPSMRCVGYRQAWEALDGASSMEDLRDKGVFATRQLARRQLTWLRSMPARRVVACDAPDALEQVLQLVDELA